MSSPRKPLFGWFMYDFANSAYTTTAAVAVLPAYFAAAVAPQAGVDILGLNFQATAIWGYSVSFSALLVFLMAPILGAISDLTASKMKFLTFMCVAGSLTTMAMFFIRPGDVLLCLGLFILAQTAFAGGNVFYDSLLPHIAKPDEMDWVSGKGFAYGYFGGGLQFAICLVVIAKAASLGLSETMAARVCLGFTGLWWWRTVA